LDSTAALTLPPASLEASPAKAQGPLLPRRAVSPDFDALLAGSLGTGLPFVEPGAARLSGVPLPVSGQILPPDGRHTVVSTSLLAGQGTLTAPVSTAPAIPAAALQPQFEIEVRLADAREQPPTALLGAIPDAAIADADADAGAGRRAASALTASQLAPIPADPRPVPALGPVPVPGIEPTTAPPTEPVVAASIAAAGPLALTAAGSAKGGSATTVAAGERRTDSVAPGSGSSPAASIAQPASDEVPALAAAERKTADPRPDTERQATDTGLPAGQSALRAERALSRDVPDATPDPARDGLKEQLGTPRWQHELGQRLVTLAGQGVREVRLQLHPEHLGPLEVRITLHDSQVGLWFGAQQAETREALEQSLPRLREMFTQGGLTMTDASVAQHHQDRGSQTAAAREAASNTPAQSGAAQPSATMRSTGDSQAARLIDEYA
jgi:flagellar hook-length control protein FliK